MTPAGALTTLTTFNGSNDNDLYSGVVQDSDGNFYGTTYGGGVFGYGTVFKMTPDGIFTNLVSFNGTNGAWPFSGLVLGRDGNFYGTTFYGGSSPPAKWAGTVFKMTPAGALTTLVSFDKTNEAGANPRGTLVQGVDGNFYGTTYLYGTNYLGGTVFKMTLGGAVTTLVTFTGDSDGGPESALLEDSDGNFYGTAGTIFKMTPAGVLTTLVSRDDANYPSGTLVQSNDGNFYGTTVGGGANGKGRVFKMTPTGILTTLASFNGPNGDSPYAGLVKGNDGNFFGTTMNGGVSDEGTIFRFSLLPVIIAQPQSQTNNAGAQVTFLVSATSLNPMSYQWQKNGTNIADGGNFSGAITTTLTIASISDSDAANYSVIVSNSYGSITSSNATLTVNNLPVFASQPQSQTVLTGDVVIFNVTAYGAPPFIFQWYYSNSPVGSPTSGTNVSSYTLTNVQTNQSGSEANRKEAKNDALLLRHVC